MASIFTRIINREIPGYIIAEDDRYIAFLDISPLVLGHTLVIPKQEVDYIFNLEDDALAGLMVFAKKVAKAVEKAVPCKRIGVSVTYEFSRRCKLYTRQTITIQRSPRRSSRKNPETYLV